MIDIDYCVYTTPLYNSPHTASTKQKASGIYNIKVLKMHGCIRRSAPVDLVPPEMQQIHLEQMRYGDWYALTFRKPAAGR